MSPHYHHYHTTYYHSAAVGYQCGICGRYARAQQRVPQCGVCMIPLCKACNRFGFCAKHFETLSPEDQTRAQAVSLKMKKSIYVFVVGMVIGFAAFMIGIPIGVTSSIHGGNIYSMFAWIFVPMGIFMAFTIGGAIYYQITLKRGYQTLQEIGAKYRTGQETPMGQGPIPAIGLQGPYFPPQPGVPGQPYYSSQTNAPAQQYFPSQPARPAQPIYTPPPAPAAPQPPVQPPAPATPLQDPYADSTSNKPVIRYCPYCGCNLSPNAQFCSNCGSTVK